MFKSTILSMNRNERRVDLTFIKNIEFVDLYLHLIKFLSLNFDSYIYLDKNKNFDKDYFLNKMEDSLDWHKEDFTFEVFFGHKKIIMVFESDKKLQQKFINEITSNAKWINTK